MSLLLWIESFEWNRLNALPPDTLAEVLAAEIEVEILVMIRPKGEQSDVHRAADSGGVKVDLRIPRALPRLPRCSCPYHYENFWTNPPTMQLTSAVQG